CRHLRSIGIATCHPGAPVERPRSLGAAVDRRESGHVAGDIPGVTGLTGRERISYSVRILLSHALYYTGILRLLQWVVFRRKAVVLVYHRVLTSEQRTRTASQ